MPENIQGVANRELMLFEILCCGSCFYHCVGVVLMDLRGAGCWRHWVGFAGQGNSA